MPRSSWWGSRCPSSAPRRRATLRRRRSPWTGSPGTRRWRERASDAGRDRGVGTAHRVGPGAPRCGWPKRSPHGSRQSRTSPEDRPRAAGASPRLARRPVEKRRAASSTTSPPTTSADRRADADRRRPESVLERARRRLQSLASRGEPVAEAPILRVLAPRRPRPRRRRGGLTSAFAFPQPLWRLLTGPVSLQASSGAAAVQCRLGPVPLL